MRILEVVFNLAPGGAERFVVDLSNELANTDEVILMAINDDKIEPETRNFYKYDLSSKVTYKCLSQNNGFSIKKIWNIYKGFKALSPDIIHLHGGPMPYFCFLAIILLCKKTKFFQTIHSDLNNGYTNWLYRLLFGFLSGNGLYGIVALSEQNYKQVVSFYPKAKAVCIPNGRAPILATNQLSIAKAELDNCRVTNDTILFVHVARFDPVKNQSLLIDSFNRFIEQGNDAALVCIGSGYDTKEGITLQNNACNRIYFLGSKKNISDYLLSSDVFCLSSDFEGLPITLIESSLAGLPAISTPVGGVASIIKNGVNGVISSDHSIDNYVECLQYVYAHYSSLRANAEKMRSDSEFTIEQCARKYRLLFRGEKLCCKV